MLPSTTDGPRFRQPTAPQPHHRCGQIDSLAGPRAGGKPYAIVEAFNPALQARSIGDSLFGNANKWGKMPVTMYVCAPAPVD